MSQLYPTLLWHPWLSFARFLSRSYLDKISFFVVGVVSVWKKEVVKLFLSIFSFEGSDELFNLDTMLYPSENQVPLVTAKISSNSSNPQLPSGSFRCGKNCATCPYISHGLTTYTFFSTGETFNVTAVIYNT